MEREKILERIRRLLAMSKDTSSPNEAAIAARRARSMMDKYQIQEIDIERHTFNNNDFGESVYKTDNKRKMPQYMNILCIAVAKFNDCRVYLDSGETVGILYKGFIADVSMCHLMMDYLVQEMKDQAFWNSNGRADANMYKLGFARGIHDQVKEMLIERKKITLSDGKQLIVVKSALVDKQYGVQKYSRGKRHKYSGSNDAYNSGYIQGKSTSLNTRVK